MVWAVAVVAVIYALATIVIAAYAMAQGHLLLLALRNPPPALSLPVADEGEPRITVQLPLFNELAVADRLIRRICELDWPKDRLQIQVLDDSNDDTVEIVAQAVRRAQAQGYDIQHVRREQRTGFKAGALAYGLQEATGEFVAIFDADFLPDPSFLRCAMRRFAHDIGLVQARWGWLNPRTSALTRAQTLHLDAHFTVEQQARSSTSLFMGFNGTAGVWRRETIDAAGGWEADTLTEDLDLSFRAQLVGWKLAYVDALVAPSELPESFAAIRTQQHRWMKGGAQVGRKLLRTIWTADLPWVVRYQATAQLFGSSVFLAVAMLCVVAPLVAPLHVASPELVNLWIGPSTVVMNTCLLVFVSLYLTTSLRRAGDVGAGVLRFLWDFPMFMTLSIGMSLHNANAAVEGWRGLQSDFVRTPKKGFGTTTHYRARSRSRLPWLELGLGVHNVAGAAYALGHAYVVGGVFLLMQGVGLGAVGVLGLRR